MNLRKNLDKFTNLLVFILAIIGFIGFSQLPAEKDVDAAIDNKPKPQISAQKAVLYKPVAKDIIQLLETNSPNKSHPRLLGTSGDFLRVRLNLIFKPATNANYTEVKKKADGFLLEKPALYDKPDKLRLSSTTIIKDRIHTLAFMYRVSGEKKYGDRALLELKTICDKNPDRTYAFPDWNPNHFLDTAEITGAAAVGFDWLYDIMSPQERVDVKNAIINNGLNVALPYFSKNNSWFNGNNNLNAVCNGGIALGALAIADEDNNTKALCGTVMEKVLASFPRYLDSFSSEGSWFEGPSYWYYSSMYATYLLSSLDSALGYDFYLSANTGFANSGQYALYVSGPTKPFNYSDSEEYSVSSSPVLLWMASKYNNPLYSYYSSNLKRAYKSNVLSMLWDSRSFDYSSVSYKQDKYFPGDEIATFHNDLFYSKDVFLGFKAGKNTLNHSDLDIGSFVYDALGERWFSELGKENYNLPLYWDMGYYSNRWRYYAKRAEGHNTLAINPGYEPDQTLNAYSKIQSFSSKNNLSYAIADLTPAYKDQCNSAKRGVAMEKATGTVIIQDEISANKPMDIWWSAHTLANITISSDKKSAILKMNNKAIQVTLNSPTNGYFDKGPAVPLPNTPIPLDQKPNWFNKLYIHLPNSSNTTIKVKITPYSLNNNSNTPLSKLIYLKDWNKSY